MMSERLEEIARDIRSNVMEVVEVLQQKESLAERVKELEDLNEKIIKTADVIDERNQRYKQIIDFLKIKIQDFEKQLISTGKLNEDKLVGRDINALLKDISVTLNALEGDLQ